MEISCFCPFCTSSRRSLRYNTSKDVYYCWRCGGKGRGNPAGVTVDERPDALPEEERRLPDGWMPLVDIPLRKPAKRRAWDYLNAHHIDFADEIEEQIGLCGFWLTVPIPNFRRMKFYVQRNLYNKSFLSAPWPKEGLVYQRGVRSEGPLFLVESVFSAIRMERFGHTLSTLGSTVTEAQCDRIANICRHRRLILLLDADAQDKVALVHRAMLKREVEVVVARLPYGDPCDYEDHDLGEVINAFA